MRKIKTFLSLLTMVFCFLIFSNSNVSAIDNSYKITKYNVLMTVNEDNTFDITEEITANFLTSKHGIFRYLPRSNEVRRADGTSSKNRVKISDIKVSEKYTKSTKNNNLVLKIGDSGKTYTGEKTYRIQYKYDIGNDPLKDKDELYFNLVGKGWDTTISNMSFEIIMPKTFDKSKLGFSSGTFGISGSKNVEFNVLNNIILGKYNGTLNSGEGVTVRLELPEGYFVERQINSNYILFYTLPFVGALIAAVFWLKYGIDRKVFVKPEYMPPKGMNSLEVGFSYRGIAQSKDVTSLLIYLANKGYLSIEECETSKNGGYKIHKVKDYDGKNENEKIFLKGLFKSGDVVTEDDLYDEFYKTQSEILSNQNSKENREKIFEKNGVKMKILAALIVLSFIMISIPPFIESGDFEEMIFSLIFPTIGLIITTMAFSSAALSVGGLKIFFLIFGLAFGGMPAAFMILPEVLSDKMFLVGFLTGLAGIIIMFIFMALLPKRTEYGANILAEVKGFKDFLESVEKERIEKMVIEQPNYFYDVLPFAYVLGVSNKWIKKFEGINLKAPEWYRGNTAFNTMAFGTFMDSTMSSAATSMSSSPSSSSSSGGFSGGGFSGGGSGGGGGGSW